MTISKRYFVDFNNKKRLYRYGHPNQDSHSAIRVGLGFPNGYSKTIISFRFINGI